MFKYIQLVYISCSTQFTEEHERQELLRIARRNNQKKQLTGLLLFQDGQFFQVLEGLEADVLGLYERIKMDIRHRACRKMAVFDVEERQFADWSMAYLKLDATDQELSQGFNDFINRADDDTASHDSEAHRLLHMFKLRTAQPDPLLHKRG